MTRRFSARVMAICANLLQSHMTDAELQNFFTEFGLLEIYRRAPHGTSKLKRVQDIIAYLDRTSRTSQSNAIWDNIVIKTVRHIEKRLVNVSNAQLEELDKALRVDGFTIFGPSMGVTELITGTSEAETIASMLTNTLKKLKLETAQVHFEQAWANYTQGYWESANSAIRSFSQEVFDKIAELRPEYPKTGLPLGGERRKFLQKIGFLSKDEGELLRSLFAILHTKGAHPGLSDENDCASRLVIAIGVAWRFLSRCQEGGI